MKIAIFGSGGLGAYYGVRFSQAGHQVSFIARGAHLDAINRQGLQLYSPLGDALLHPVNASAHPTDLGEQDLVLVAVKTWQLPDVAESMAPLMGEQTLVVPFLNGIEAVDVLADKLGRNPVLGGLSRIFSKLESPGCIRHFNDSAFVEIGEPFDAGPSERCRQICDAFAEAGVETELSENIRANLWRKLILVCSWGGLGALSQSPMGDLKACDETRELITQCAHEAIAVAAAEGHVFADNIIETHWQFYETLPAQATTSLSRDLLAGMPSELEAWQGEVVRLADKHQIDVPNLRFVYRALLPMEMRARA